MLSLEYAVVSMHRHSSAMGYANRVVRWGSRMCAGRENQKMLAGPPLTTYRMWSTLRGAPQRKAQGGLQE